MNTVKILTVVFLMGVTAVTFANDTFTKNDPLAFSADTVALADQISNAIIRQVDKDKANITWGTYPGAVTYKVFQDNTEIMDVKDRDIMVSSYFNYKIVAVNKQGKYIASVDLPCC